MLRSARPRLAAAPEGRQMRLLQDFRAVLEQGMASIDEYGDMLKWALPGDGCRYFHVFDPGFCSFSDAYRGTVHDHGGKIRGTVLLGAMEHAVYDPTPDPDGDRLHAGIRYRFTRHTDVLPAGTDWSLDARVAHWTRPLELSVTYFEEEDNEVMGELADPVGAPHDEHPWTQEDAEALVPRLLTMVDARLTVASPL